MARFLFPNTGRSAAVRGARHVRVVGFTHVTWAVGAGFTEPSLYLECDSVRDRTRLTDAFSARAG